MNQIIQYFEASKPAAIAVTWVELLMFVAWICLLVWQILRIRNTQKGFEQLEHVVPELERAVLGRELGEAPEGARRSFDTATSHVGDVSNIAREHLWTLFSIGYQDLDLDASELIRKSDEQVCLLDSPLRNTIGIFVVLGLLGTLFSVADAITLLSGGGKTDVHQFLRELSGAFAPSLTGVLISIVCALSYAWLQIARNRMRVVLRERTVRDWAPRLRPPVTRRLQEASQRTLDAAGDVVRFANDIRRRTKSWKIAVKASTASAQTIASAMGAMSLSLIEARTTAQAILGDMNGKLEGLNQALGEWRTIGAQIVEFREASARAQEQQAQVASRIEQHSDRLATATQELKQENSAALSRLNEAVAGLGAPVQSAADRIEGIAVVFARESHQAVAGLAAPLQATTEHLETISSDFSAGCTKIASSLAEQLERTAESLNADHRAGWAKVEASVQDRINILVKSASDLASVFTASIESLGQLHRGELAEVKAYFGTLSAELQLRATDIVSDLSNLGEPFRAAAERVSDSATHAERMLTGATVRLETAAGAATADVTDLARYIRESAAQRPSVDGPGPGAVVQRELLSAITSLKDAVDKLQRYTQPTTSSTTPGPDASDAKRSNPGAAAESWPEQTVPKTPSGAQSGAAAPDGGSAPKMVVEEPPIDNTTHGWWRLRWLFRGSRRSGPGGVDDRESDRLNLDGK